MDACLIAAYLAAKARPDLEFLSMAEFLPPQVWQAISVLLKGAK